KLYDFITLSVISILHLHVHIEGIACVQFCGGELQVAVFKLRIAQAIAEGIKRFPVEVPERTVPHRIVFKRWQLLDTFVEGHGQAASWIVFSRKSLSNRSSAFFSGIPGIEDCIRMLRSPVYRKRAAV